MKFSILQLISLLTSVTAFHSVHNPRTRIFLHAEKAGGSDNDAGQRNETVVTKEMFLRDMLQDPVVKRKKKSSYKVLDNRDSLPFAVEIATPDPYTHPEVKRKNAAKNKVSRKKDAVENAISSSLYYEGDQKIGDFMLDKHTTTGDVLEVADVQYKVVRHKCQYKYAGGKRFVMVRKILQVKEIGRLQTEEYLQRQLDNASKLSDDSL